MASAGGSILGAIVGGADHGAQGPGALPGPDDLPAEPGHPALHRDGGREADLPGIVAIVLAEQFVAGFGMTAHGLSDAALPRAFSASHFASPPRSWCRWPARCAGFLSGPLDDRLGSPVFFTSLRRQHPQPGAGVLRPHDADRSRARARPVRCDVAAVRVLVRARRRRAFDVGLDARLGRSAGHPGRGGRVRLSVHARGSQGARPLPVLIDGPSRGAGRGAGERQGAGVPDR